LAHVWQGDEVGRESACLASGHAALDLHLPGGGWPEGGLVEVLQARPEAHAWRLVLPALVKAVQAHEGPVVLVAPPREPFGPSLAAHGLPSDRLLWVRAGQPAARLWVAEQALRCGDVVATLAWLPQARQAELRRLHLLSQQQGRLFFAFRTLQARQESSPARLRLLLEGEGDVLRVHLLKRRGPPLASPVLLAAQEGRLKDLLRARRRSAPAPAPWPAVLSEPVPATEKAHALAGLAVSG
jgi:protein ImuA